MGSLLRRIISVLLLGILVVAIIMGIVWLRFNDRAGQDPQSAVPPGFALCLETENYYRLSSSLQNHNDLWRELQVYEEIEKLNENLHNMDSLTRSNPHLKNLLGGRFIFSLYPTSRGLDFLTVLNSDEKNVRDEVLKLISSDTEIDKVKYENLTIYNLRFKDNFISKISFTESRNLLLLASGEEMLKLAVNQIREGRNVFRSKQFDPISSTLGEDVEAHLFIDFSSFESFMEGFLQTEHIPDLSGFSSAAALDLELKPDQVLFNGFSSGIDSVFQKLDLFEGQKAVEHKIFNVIPSSVTYFKWLGISSIPEFKSRLVKRGNGNPRDEKLRDIFFGFFEGQAAEILLRKGENTYSKLLVLSVKSQGQASEILNEYFNEKGDLEADKLNIDDNNFVEAYKLPGDNIAEVFFDDLFRKSQYEWYCFFENHLILAREASELQEYIYLNTLGKTLNNDDYFQGLKDNFSSRSNFFIYLDPSQYFEELTQFLDPKVRSFLERQEESWKKINILGFQSTVADNLNYFRCFINYTGKIREYVNTVWERKLEARLAIKPAIVTNHNNGEKEIFVQDENDFINLINNNGSILWKQKLDGKILSQIFQVDYYQNNKLQYLFNTSKRLYLIDRNGNSVEKYPVTLREEASAGISLFDYDNNKTYRIPVPTVDRDILMYDLNGDIVSGWRFRKADRKIRFPLHHYRIGDKDYIVGKDEFNLYILNRRGRKRVNPDSQIDFSENNPLYYVSGKDGKSPRLIASDQQGKVFEFYFTGETRKILDTGMNPKHFFLPEDINGDGETEYVFIDSTKLEVYDKSAELIFSETFPEEISHSPVIYSFSASDKKIGVVAQKSGRIYLFNNDGSIYQGFPLQGASLFSISSFPGLKDRFNLLVGNNDNFLYNYSVK